MPTPTRFVILFEGRTGSSYLISALSSLPHIQAADEILAGLDGEAQRALVRDFFLAARPPLVRALGFKTKLRDIRDPVAFSGQLESLGGRVIHLTRVNKVKLAVSRLNGRRLHELTGQWNQTAAGPALAPFAPTLEEFDSALRFRMERETALDAYIPTLRVPVLTVRYEDLFPEGAATFARIFDFLGAEPGPVSSPVVKITDDDLRKVLLNFDELRRHYAGTENGAMFD
jgi:LPS sulfotransferase NodH